jgi:hypothetical protein
LIQPGLSQQDSARGDGAILKRRRRNHAAGATPPTITCLLLLTAAAWLRGGTVVKYQVWLLIPSAILLLLMVWSRARDKTVISSRLEWATLWTLSLAFLAVLALQWWNAGQYQFFHPLRQAWVYTNPRHPGFPGAVSAADVLEMFRWFVPAIVLLLVLKSGRISPRGQRWLLVALLAQASLLAVVGLLQRATGGWAFLGLEKLDVYYFASFGYANHAGSYFVLMTAMACGCLLQAARNALQNEKFTWNLPAYAVAGGLCFVAANLSLSRAAIVLAWGLMIVCIVWSLLYFWPRIRPAQRVNLLAALFGLGVILVMGVIVASGGDITSELRTIVRDKHEREINPVQSLSPEVRVALASAAWAMWRDHPWYGVGSWGFRYRLHEYLSADQKKLANTKGRANTHNDMLQFLAEFGLAGFLPLLGLIGLAAAGGWRTRCWQDPAAAFIWLGALLVLVHSMVDLPFRSPAVMLAWLTAVICAPAMIPVASGEHARA